VRQNATPRAIVLYRQHDVVVWWATPVEIASTLARLARLKQIDPGDGEKAQRLAQTLADSWSTVQPSDALRDTAERLLDRYDLRAADALQLAAALEWCENDPSGRIFFTADQRLREAAALAGFDATKI
jgi:predicted nucleic acid-binding protein